MLILTLLDLLGFQMAGNHYYHHEVGMFSKHFVVSLLIFTQVEDSGTISLI